MDELKAIEYAKQGYSVCSLSISDATYNRSEKISDFLRASDLKNALNGDISHYWRTRNIKKPESESPDSKHLNAGHYIEDVISGLTPTELDKKYLVFDPEDRPDKGMTMAAKENKAWKQDYEAYAFNHELIWIEASEVECVKHLKPSHSDSRFLDFCRHADKQLTCLWTDKTGLKLRSRTDFSCRSKRLIVDVKTTFANTLRKFLRQAEDLNYKTQALMQVDGMRKTEYMQGTAPVAYFWLAVSKKWPYNIFLVEYTHGSQARDMEALYRSPLAMHYEVLKLGQDPPQGEIFQI